MSNLNTAAYENVAQLYFRQNPRNFEKFYSPTLLATLVAEMQSSLPSVVAARLAFQRLVANGLQRTDGRTEADDRVEAKAVARANLEKVIGEIDSAPRVLARANFRDFISVQTAMQFATSQFAIVVRAEISDSYLPRDSTTRGAGDVFDQQKQPHPRHRHRRQRKTVLSQ